LIRYTIDTSVIGNGFIPPRRRKQDSIYKEQLRLHTIAKSFLTEVETKKIVMNIPSVALVEIAAVASRLTGKNERGTEAVNYLRKQGTIFYDTQFLETAIQIAIDTRISGFDAVFIAIAKLTNSTLITDDKGMHKAAVSLGINSKLLRDLK